MSTAVYVGIAVSWILTLGLLVALLVRVSRWRQDDARTSDELATLRAQVEALAATAADLRAELRSRDLSDSQPASGAAGSDTSMDDVAVITGLAEDDADLTAGRVASVTLAGPLMKAAALSYGVRHALHEEQRMRTSYAMRKELRRQRKMRRRRRAQRSRSEGWVS